MEIVSVADVAQRADKAAVSRAVVELAFDSAVAVVEKFDQQVEHVDGFCGTVGVARHDCGSPPSSAGESVSPVPSIAIGLRRGASVGGDRHADQRRKRMRAGLLHHGGAMVFDRVWS